MGKYHTAEGVAVMESEAQQVGVRRQLGEVELRDFGEGGDKTPRLVEYFDRLKAVGVDYELTSGGVGVDLDWH